jgi:hypothetical protein
MRLNILLKLSFFLSVSFFWVSCSEPTIEEESQRIIDLNHSSDAGALDDSDLIRSADGLQFTRPSDGDSNDQSIGYKKDGSIAYKGNLKNNKPEGTWSTFYPDGKKLWQGVKKNGVNDGPFTMWYPNGKVKMKGQYKKGLKEGKSTIYHLSGNLWKEQWHQVGNPSGEWSTWNEDGDLIEEIAQDKPTKTEDNSSGKLQLSTTENK